MQGLQTQIELGSLTVRRQRSEFRETSVLRHQGRVSDGGNCTGEKKKFFRGPSFTLWLNSDLPICIRKLPAAGEKTPENGRPNNSWSSRRTGKEFISAADVERLGHVQGIELSPQKGTAIVLRLH